MCGVIAVIHANGSSDGAAIDLHEALYMLQHRGQDACGIATCASGGRIYQCKGNGMAGKVFHDGQRVRELPGSMGLGHLRYPTAGTSANAEAQPFYVNSPYGICFTHNGNLINTEELKTFLDKDAHRHVNTNSDSEVMLNIFANELNVTGKARINYTDVFDALKRTYARCKGGWACAGMIAGYGLIAFRDPYGIRPLCLGSRANPEGNADYMISSESVALQSQGFDNVVDIKPGQAVIIEKDQPPRFSQVQESLAYSPDIFEYVYFARPDSVIDGISVLSAREKMGETLADMIIKQVSAKDLAEIDAVIPIPETANISARSVAEKLGKKLGEGFMKNRYIFRTFIMPSARVRRTGVRRKLNPIRTEFENRNVLLVDDSIVRGTTSEQIVEMARECGAKKVFFASCAPPITHAHIYGIDLASTSELIAHGASSEDIAKRIGADQVIYQSLEDLTSACASAEPSPATTTFEVGVFCGNYVTPVDKGYFEHLERIRGDRPNFNQRKHSAMSQANGKPPLARLASRQERSQDIALDNLNDHEA